VILKNKIYIIVGIGTDIGKTFLLEKICLKFKKNAMPVNAIKPIISGFDGEDLLSDSAKILQIFDKDLTKNHFDDISPWRFKEPVSPNFAARKEGKNIDFREVINFCRKKIDASNDLDQFLFIESAGGVMTPITDDKTFLDLITELKIPVLLLGSNYLGAISHSLCAIEALKSRDIVPELVIINNYPDSSLDISQTKFAINNISKVNTLDIDDFMHQLS